MVKNLRLDDELLESAVRLGNHATDEEAVTAALREYVSRKRQMGVLELEGRIDFDPAYDPKAERRARCE